jgi:hypothetical protein
LLTSFLFASSLLLATNLFLPASPFSHDELPPLVSLPRDECLALVELHPRVWHLVVDGEPPE